MINNTPFLLKPSLLKTIQAGSYIAANQERRGVWSVDGVGVVPVNGVMMQEDSFLAAFFGGSSYMSIRTNLNKLDNDPEIKAIILDINSPGGDAFGCSELAEYIKTISKPIITYVSGEAASAAYWTASASNMIVAHKTALVGSIGSYMALSKDESIYVVSEQSPMKVPDINSDEGVSQIRAHLNTLTNSFIADVASYRGKEFDYVSQNFGRGDVVSSQDALEKGMIDKIGNFAVAMSEAKNYTQKKDGIITNAKNIRRPTMAKRKLEFVIVDSEAVTEGASSYEVTVETIKQNFPDIANQLIEEGKKNSQEEMAETVETASLADMTNEEEAAAVTQALSGKISSTQLAKTILQIKSKTPVKTNNVLANRMADQPAVASVGGGDSISAQEQNGLATRGFLKAFRGGKK